MNQAAQTLSHQPDVHMQQKALGKAFWAMAQKHKLKRCDQAVILGIKNYPQRLGMLEQKHSIPDDVDKFARVGHLLGIHKNLRMLYPYNSELVYGFFRIPWSLIEGQTPLEFLHQAPQISFERLFTLRRLLDMQRTSR